VAAITSAINIASSFNRLVTVLLASV
jgi:hypothetical protein